MTSSVGSPNLHPTPLFQRLVSEEVQELKAYNRIIESQNRRLAELERVHGDLEVRLEVQSNRRLELEKTLEDRERTWAEEIHEIEQERDQQKDLVTAERSKNGRLMDQVVRKDQDIQRMLQRKVSYFSIKKMKWILTCLITMSPDLTETNTTIILPHSTIINETMGSDRQYATLEALANLRSPQTATMAIARP